MVKSILPSTSRKAAKKDKDHLHRRNRRNNKLIIGTFHGPADYIEDLYDDVKIDLTYCSDPHNNEGWDPIVDDRRARDKINHFERWAWKKTRNVRMEDRLTKMQSIIPRGVIGDHAISHLNFLDPNNRFVDKYNPERIPYRMRNQGKKERARQQAKAAAALREQLIDVCKNKKTLAKFNAYLNTKATRTQAFEKNSVAFIKQRELYNINWNVVKAYGWSVEYVQFVEVMPQLRNAKDVPRFMREIIWARRVADGRKHKIGYHPNWYKATKEYFS